MIIHLPYLPVQKASPSAVTAPAPTEKPAPDQAEWLASLYRRAELFPAMTALQDTMRPVEHYGRSHQPRVLIADDEPDMLRFLKAQLRSQFEVIEADGQQAVEKAAQFLRDVIVCDMMMPEKGRAPSVHRTPATHHDAGAADSAANGASGQRNQTGVAQSGRKRFLVEAILDH